jgi:uncharacterized protein (UPF0335 family)
MAIVASETGGPVRCEGGSHSKNGQSSVSALSWEQVNKIVRRFDGLKPYDPAAVPGSLLKIEEKENYDKNGNQRQLYTYAISAKRYALFTLDPHGMPILHKKSEHGLGHLLSPIDTYADKKKWIEDIWKIIVSEAVGLRVETPKWLELPAVTRQTISSPAIAELFEPLNAGRNYRESTKPFNFILAVHVVGAGYPLGADEKRFQLIAPYDSDPANWIRLPWINRYDGNAHLISINGDLHNPDVANVSTYRDVLEMYRHHAETKSLGPDGKPANKQTKGLLKRRPVYELERRTIGKEANRLEEREANLIHDQDEVLNDFHARGQDAFALHVIQNLDRFKAEELAALSDVSGRYIQGIRNGYKKNPNPRARAALTRAAAHALRNSGQVADDQSEEKTIALANYLKERTPTR